ncbi:MAG TPA: hypothetical protein VHM91_11370, partial [Verrucomicrobiales bacterium]|nr:hypothetical protein [Verrucomicrobiales bacterium]
KILFLATSAGERRRLAASAAQHARPARTRTIAAFHLLKGAALLPSGSDEKAKMLNNAGWLLQDIDTPAADRIYFQIERSLSGTPAGSAILKKKWFLGYIDPW